MAKPTIQQIQEQIESLNRRVGKISDKDLFLKRRFVDDSDESIDGNVKWRRLSWINPIGEPGFVPAESIRDYVSNYYNEKEAELTTPSNESLLNIREVTNDNSTITDTNIAPFEHVVWFTSVWSETSTVVPFAFNQVPFKNVKIDAVYTIGEDTHTVSNVKPGQGSVAYIPVPGSTASDKLYVTIMLYVYNSDISSKKMSIDTGILEYTKDNKSPTPYKPENLIASRGSSVDAVNLTWDFDPFVFSTDNIEVWKGFTNGQGEIIRMDIYQTIPGYSTFFSDTNVLSSQRYAYRIRYTSVDGYVSEFSDVKVGYVNEPPINAVATLRPNSLTGLEGYYKSRVVLDIVTDFPLENGPIVQHIEPGGETITATTIGSDNNWTASVDIALERDRTLDDTRIGWKEGQATYLVKVAPNASAGSEGQPLGSASAGGTVIAQGTYIVDGTAPILSNFSISNNDDLDADGFTATETVFLFGDADSRDSDVNTLTQDGQKHTSGIYQIKFANNLANSDAGFSEWIDWEPNTSYKWNLNLPQGATIGTAYVYAKVRDRAGNVSDTHQRTIKVALSRPAEILSVGYSEEETSVNLSWNTATGESASGYSIYRSFDTANPADPRNTSYYYKKISSLSETSYADLNVAAASSYAYAMRIVDRQGREGTAWSNVISGVSPLGITSTGAANDSPVADPAINNTVRHWQYVDIYWPPNTEFNFSHYNVYRASGSTAWANVDVVETGLRDPFYRDFSVGVSGTMNSGVSYGYWVAAVNEVGDIYGSGGIAETSLSLRVDGPTAPLWDSGNSEVDYGYNHLVFSGGGDEDEFVSFYKLYRVDVIDGSNSGTTGFIGSVPMRNGETDGEYNDTDTLPGQEYTYYAAGVNQFGIEGDQSEGLTGLGPALPNYQELFVNMLDNGDFSRTENDEVASWGTRSPISVVSSSFKRFGTRGVQYTNSNEPIQEYVFARPTTDYYFSCYTRGLSATSGLGNVLMSFYGVNSVSPISTSSFAFGHAASGIWLRTGWQVTTPTGTTRMELTLSGATNNIFVYDGVQFEEYVAGESPRPFINSRTMSADRIQAFVINGDMISGGTIQGKHIQAETISGELITASSITADKLLVGFPGNLVFNGRLGFGANYITTATGLPGWDYYSVNATYFVDAQLGDAAITGNEYRRAPGDQYVSFDGAYGDGGLYTDSPYLIHLDTGNNYTLSFWSAPDGYSATGIGSTGYTNINCYDGDNGYIGDINVGVFVATGWLNHRFEYTINSASFPANTAKIGIELGSTGGSAGDGYKIAFAGVQLEKGNASSDFAGGFTSIDETMIRTNAIKAEHISASVVDATHIRAGTISGDNIAGTTVTTDKLTTTFGANLVIDGGFERWTNGVPDLWSNTSYTVKNQVSGQNNSVIGPYSYGLSGSSGANARHNKWIKIPRDADGNTQPVNVSLWVRRNDATHGNMGYMSGRFVTASDDGNGNPVELTFNTTTAPGTFSNTVYTGGTVSSWTRIDKDFTDWSGPLSSGADYFQVRLWPLIDNGSGNKPLTEIDGVQVTVGSGVQNWKSNEGTVIEGDWIKTGKISSNDYVAGTSGWQVDIDGDAEFNDGTFRGTLDVGDIGGQNVIIDGAFERWGPLAEVPGAGWGWAEDGPAPRHVQFGAQDPSGHKASGNDTLFGDSCIFLSGTSAGGAKFWSFYTNEIYKIAEDANGDQKEGNLSIYARFIPETAGFIASGGIRLGMWMYQADANGNIDVGTATQEPQSTVALVVNTGTSASGVWHRATVPVVTGTASTTGEIHWGGASYRFFQPYVEIWGSGYAYGDLMKAYLDGFQFTWSDNAQPFGQSAGTRISGEWIEAGAIKSSDFATGASGWQIDLDGDAEFSDVRIRGNATIGEGATVSGVLNVTGEDSEVIVYHSGHTASIPNKTTLNEQIFSRDYLNETFSYHPTQYILVTSFDPRNISYQSVTGYAELLTESGWEVAVEDLYIGMSGGRHGGSPSYQDWFFTKVEGGPGQQIYEFDDGAGTQRTYYISGVSTYPQFSVVQQGNANGDTNLMMNYKVQFRGISGSAVGTYSLYTAAIYAKVNVIGFPGSTGPRQF